MPSSVIRAFRYDRSQRRLHVVFNSGERYDYLAVPPGVADGLREARSKGQFFNARIRDRFPFEHHR